MSTSNQNAGADRKPCRWCSLWQAAYWASQLDWKDAGKELENWILAFKWLGTVLLSHLGKRDPGECLGCQKARSIQLGIHQTPAETAWRAAMYEQNPVMRQFMRPGKHDTFTEAGDAS